MISKKLIELAKYYTSEKKSKDELISFCNQFDVIFSNFINEIEKEVGESNFSLLDEIFMICDFYESNEDIRKKELYCINEDELQHKVSTALAKIDNKMM